MSKKTVSKKPTVAELEAIADLPLREIGKHYGVSGETVRGWYRREGIERKSYHKKFGTLAGEERVDALEKLVRETYDKFDAPPTVDELIEAADISQTLWHQIRRARVKDLVLARKSPSVTYARYDWAVNSPQNLVRQAHTDLQIGQEGKAKHLSVLAYNEWAAKTDNPAAPSVLHRSRTTWNELLASCGLPHASSSGPNKSARYTQEACVLSVAAYVDETKTLTAAGYDQWAREDSDRPSLSTVMKTLEGGWHDIARAAVRIQQRARG